MFQVGDKIFYPLHGGCIICAIKNEEVLGTVQPHFVADIPYKNMRIIFPVDKIEKLGLRHIVDNQKIDDILSGFYDQETDIIVNDNQRYKRNMTKLKSGDIFEGVEVIRDLVRTRKKKKLCIMDQKMLENAQQILVSEIALVKGISEQQATVLLDDIINGR